MLFSKLNLNRGEWLDLVFQNRNRSYGAYEIRRDADSYLLKALFISFGFFGLFIGTTVYYLNKNKDATAAYTVKDQERNLDNDRIVKLEDFAKETPPIEIIQPAEERIATNVPQVNMAQVKYTRMRPVEDSKGVDAPNVTILKDNIIGSNDIEGAKPAIDNLALGTVNGKEEIAGGKEIEDRGTYDQTMVERMQAFKNI